MKFCTRLDINTSPLRTTGRYFIAGYPIDPNYSNLLLRSWTARLLICEVGLSKSTYTLQNCNDGEHIVFEIDLNNAMDVSGRGSKLPESLMGISGGPVFQITPDGIISVIAVEVSTYQKANRLYIKTIPWPFVLGLIDTELRGIEHAARLLLRRGRSAKGTEI